jgi:very-short-patch-repair endonuclease
VHDVDGIVVLTPTFWLISQAPDSTDDRLLALAIDARQRRLLVHDDVASRLDTMPHVPGRGRLLRVLRRLASDGSESIFETRVREKLLDAGLYPSAMPLAVPTIDGRTVHFDIAFPAQRVAIECVGLAAHSTRRQLDRDARRENAIARTGGWVVLKLTWDRFLHDWDGFLAELRHALARAH